MLETHLDDAGQLVFLKPHACGVGILLLQCGAKHSWVIGGEHNGYAVTKEFGKRMIFDSCVLAAELPGEGAGFHIAPRTYFQRDLALCEQVHYFRIVDRGDSVAYALSTKQFDGFANFLRADDFACVHHPAQTDLSGTIIDGTKLPGRNAELVAAHAEGH